MEDTNIYRKNHDNLVNLCASCLIDGGGYHGPLTLRDAEYTLEQWAYEGGEFAADTLYISPREFMETWNNVFRSFRQGSAIPATDASKTTAIKDSSDTKGVRPMKTLYIAREADDNTDDIFLSFDHDAAYREAEQMFDHLTKRERMTTTVSFETYRLDVPEDDPRTAEQLYSDMCYDDVFPIDPDEYKKISPRTWGDYFEEHDGENLSWCKPYTDTSGDYWLVMHDGEPEQIDSPSMTTDRWSRVNEVQLELFAREVNPDYDLYSGWSDHHIALDVMHETGCFHCPFFDECQVMGERMEDGDNR